MESIGMERVGLAVTRIISMTRASTGATEDSDGRSSLGFVSAAASRSLDDGSTARDSAERRRTSSEITRRSVADDGSLL